MSDKYKIFKGDDPYFVTFTIVEWIKVLADNSFKDLIIDSIKYCQENKGMTVYGYFIMPNHVHMIIQAVGRYSVSEILRDLKKFTAKAIVGKLNEDKQPGYEAIMNQFIENSKPLKRIRTYKVWQDGNHAEILYSNELILEKLACIHNNPVKYGLSEVPWSYAYSSATNYAEMDSVLEVVLLSL